MTPAFPKLWQQGRLDARCRDCGEGMAATGWCYKCGSRSLEYLPHESGQPCLASGRVGRASIPPRIGQFSSAERPQTPVGASMALWPETAA